MDCRRAFSARCDAFGAALVDSTLDVRASGAALVDSMLDARGRDQRSGRLRERDLRREQEDDHRRTTEDRGPQDALLEPLDRAHRERLLVTRLAFCDAPRVERVALARRSRGARPLAHARDLVAPIVTGRRWRRVLRVCRVLGDDRPDPRSVTRLGGTARATARQRAERVDPSARCGCDLRRKLRTTQQRVVHVGGRHSSEARGTAGDEARGRLRTRRRHEAERLALAHDTQRLARRSESQLDLARDHDDERGLGRVTTSLAGDDVVKAGPFDEQIAKRHRTRQSRARARDGARQRPGRSVR